MNDIDADIDRPRNSFNPLGLIEFAAAYSILPVIKYAPDLSPETLNYLVKTPAALGMFYCGIDGLSRFVTRESATYHYKKFFKEMYDNLNGLPATIKTLYRKFMSKDKVLDISGEAEPLPEPKETPHKRPWKLLDPKEWDYLEGFRNSRSFSYVDILMEDLLDDLNRNYYVSKTPEKVLTE